VWQYRNRTAQDRGIVKILVFLTSFLCLGAFASNAVAAEVNIKGSVSQTLNASDNFFLSNSPSGPTYQSYTTASLNMLARTPDTNYLLNGSWSLFNYYGPGAQDTSLRWGTPASANFAVDHTTVLDRFNLAGSWTRSDIVTTLLAQTGTAGVVPPGGRGFLDTFSITGGLARDLSRIDTIRWQAAASQNSSDDPNFTPYVDVNSSLSYIRQLNHTTSLVSSLSVDWFNQNDPAQSQRLLWNLSGFLTSQVTSRFSVNGHLGMLWVNSWQNNPGAAVGTNPFGTPFGLGFGFVPFQPLTGAAHSLIWDAGFSYSLLKTTNLSMTFAQTIFPVVTGQLQKTEGMGLNISHQINNASSLSFFANVNRTVTTTTTPTQFFSGGLIYSYRLARDWNANFSYTYRQREDPSPGGGGFVNGNTFLFSLNYNFNIMGNSGAFAQAEAARARLRAQQAIGYVFPGYLGAGLFPGYVGP
jgi:hypothetical protein